MTEWWEGVTSLAAPVRCAEQGHTLVWLDGELAAVDHPDADRERALIALGGPPAECLDLVTAWERHRADLAVLVVAPRHPGDLIHEHSHAEDGWYAYAGPRGPARRGGRRHRTHSTFGAHHEPDPLAPLLALGHGMAQRLSATVIAEWCARIERGEQEVAVHLPALRAALYGRLQEVVRSWCGPDRAVDVDLAEPDATPTVDNGPAAARFVLPLRWLRDVWARDLSVVSGRLTLDAERLRPDGWRLLTVGPDLTDLRTMTITLR